MLFKKSSSYKIGEGVTSFKINNFNDNPIDGFKKSRTYREENIYGLNLPYQANNNGQNRFATILETINEVSSKIDSSELCDNDDKNNKNNNNENNDNL